MEKHIDLIVIETKENIAKVANDSQLPLSILQMIFNEIFSQITNNLNAKLIQLKAQQENEKQTSEN